MAKYISNVWKIPMWIRIVYLPGITDKENALYRLRNLLHTLQSIEKIEVLPYHEMGVYKWKNMGLNYPLEGQAIPSKEECIRLEEWLKEDGNRINHH